MFTTWGAAAHVGNGRYLVRGFDVDAYTAGGIRECAHRGVGKKGLQP
jgi:hypothetical protein